MKYVLFTLEVYCKTLKKRRHIMKTQKDVVVVVKTKSGNPVLMYCGANVPHEKPYLIGTRVIGNFLPAELLGEALRLIKQ